MYAVQQWLIALALKDVNGEVRVSTLKNQFFDILRKRTFTQETLKGVIQTWNKQIYLFFWSQKGARFAEGTLYHFDN